MSPELLQAGLDVANAETAVRSARREPRADRAPSQRGHRLAAVRDWERQHAPGYMLERAELPDMSRSYAPPSFRWVDSAWFIVPALIVVGVLLYAVSQGVL